MTGAHDAAFAERAAASAAEVVLLGEVPDAVLPALFERAAAVALLAASEGFALPVLEAFARGTPVVVPRGSVQAATADGLALEVDAEDPASVAEGIARALGRDFDGDALRANAAVRTWDATAARLVEVWGALL